MKNIKPHLALFAVALIYGANYTIAKEVLDPGHVQPIGFIGLRAGAGMILFWMVQYFAKSEKIKKEDWKLLVLCAFLGVFTNQILFFIGLKWTSAIHASLIITGIPIAVMISAALILREKITRLKILGIIIGIIGATYLITSGKSLNFESSQILGDLCVLGNTISYGLYLVLVRRLMLTYHPFTVLRWVFTFGFLMVIPFAIPDLIQVNWSSLSGNIWAAIGYVLIFTTFLTYLLNAYALKRTTATVVGMYVYLQPIIATTIAIGFAKDVLTTPKVIAAILIFTGVWLVNKKQ